MGPLVLHADESVAAPPTVVFGLFGSGARAGWLFDAVCDRVAVGAAVRMCAPLLGPDADPIDIIGRISAVRPPSRIDVVHDQPWRGCTKLRFQPSPEGTRVRLIAEIDESGLQWLMARRGFPTLAPDSSNVRLGLLTTKSGPGSLFAGATDNLARLAIAEINAEGGVHGRSVELVVGDDATDARLGVAEALRLTRAGCRTILVATTSATFTAVSHALQGHDVLLVQTLMNEGGYSGPLRVQLGERPTAQLTAAAGPLMRIAGGRRWFLAGDDYCWPRAVHTAARQVLPHYGAHVVGERFAAIGTGDFSTVIEAIHTSGAEIVLSTFVGADAAAFERQCHAMGLRERCVTLAPAMDESTLTYVGDAAASGLYTISGYVERLPTDGNADLLHRYRDMFGRWAPPLSTLSEAVFEAVYIWWSAARTAGADDPAAITRMIRPGRFELPRGTVVLDESGEVDQRLHLAAADGAGLRPETT
jgi:branched-chain amino acid transport system substrate-binding protein